MPVAGSPITVLAAAAIVAITVSALPGSANAASFSCYGPLTKTERAICNDRYLSRLDEVMSRAYFRLLNDSYGWRRYKLQQDQIRWLADRNSCGANVWCLNAAYQSRLSQIDDRQDDGRHGRNY